MAVFIISHHSAIFWALFSPEELSHRDTQVFLLLDTSGSFYYWLNSEAREYEDENEGPHRGFSER